MPGPFRCVSATSHVGGGNDHVCCIYNKRRIVRDGSDLLDFFILYADVSFEALVAGSIYYCSVFDYDVHGRNPLSACAVVFIIRVS